MPFERSNKFFKQQIEVGFLKFFARYKTLILSCDGAIGSRDNFCHALRKILFIRHTFLLRIRCLTIYSVAISKNILFWGGESFLFLEKRMKKLLTIALLSTVMASALNAADNAVYEEYRIEVCAIPLSEIVNPESKDMMKKFNFQHIFLRGIEGEKITVNFEPMDGQSS